jgi:tetratricopeptide (TPR) repeat protein
VVVLVLVTTGTASADQRSRADDAFRRGREAFKAERFAEACEAFEESQALDPQLGTQFNLAQCFEKIGKLASALAIYKELVAVDTNAIRIRLTNDAIDALASRVPKIRVVIEQRPPGLVVSLQDARGSARPIDIDQPVLVDVGDYKVLASGKGVRDWSAPVSGSEGQTTQVVVVLEARPDGGERVSIWHPRARGRLRAAGIFTAGGVAVLGSFALGVSAYSYHRDAEDVCGGGSMCPTQADVDAATALRDKGQRRGTIATILFAVGAAGMGTGAVMYLLAKHAEPRVTARLDATGATLVLSGTF